MHPDLFKSSASPFPSYFVLLLSGFLFATAAGRSGPGASARARTPSSTSASRCSSPGWRARAFCMFSPTATSGTTCTSALILRCVDWPLDRGECLSPAFDGVWDAAKAVCHPKGRGLLRVGEVLGGRPERTTGASRRAVGAAWILLRRDRFPFWKARGHGGLRHSARAGLRSHGLPDGGVLLRRDVRSALGDVVSVAERRRARRSSRRTSRRSAKHVEPARCTPRRSTSRPLRSPSRPSVWSGCIRASVTTARCSSCSSRSTRSPASSSSILRRDDRGGCLGLSTSQLIGVGAARGCGRPPRAPGPPHAARRAAASARRLPSHRGVI